MIRRFSVLFAVCLLLFAFSHNLVAQVYPDREELDVVRLVDGTILKGVILEQVPDQYLEIQLYGGSTFVLGYEQIESVEREENPDYAPTWIKVRLADLQAPEDDAAHGDAAAASAPGDTRSLLDGGLTLGMYLGAGPGWFDGPDWGADLPDDPDNLIMQNIGAGFFFRATGQPAFLDDTIWLWGLRGGIGAFYREGGFYADDPFGIGDLEYEEWTDIAHLPLEVLFGGAGDRFALYGGVGPGLSILLRGQNYQYDFKGTGDPDNEQYDKGTSVSIIATARSITTPWTLPLASAIVLVADSTKAC